MDEDTDEAKRPSSGEKVSFQDFCRMIPLTTPSDDLVEKCFNTGQLIDYIYDLATNSYPIENYATDEDLLKQIKKGRSQPSYIKLFAKNFLAETVPEEIEQDEESSIITELTKAKAASWSFFIRNSRNEDIDETFYEVWEELLMDKTEEWNKNAK